jgi:L-rhamnose isomerase
VAVVTGPVSGITEEMIERAAEAVRGVYFDWPGEADPQMVARAVLEAALSGLVVVPEVREHCRACHHERDKIVPAEYIVWGKYAKTNRLGPSCYDHTVEVIGHAGMSRIDQYAVFDLRPFRAAAGEARRIATESGEQHD